jgi:hypothetical protein
MWNSKHGRIFRLYSAVNAKDAIPNDFFEDKKKGLIAGQWKAPLSWV